MDDEPFYDQPVTIETKAANARHDAEHHSISMDPRIPLRSRNVQNAISGPLTDKKITKYQEAGFYSESFREVRREYWQRKSTKNKPKRDGNFLVFNDGRKVFAPS